MSAPSSARRLLRPRFVHVAACYIWIIDDTQPVAALLDPDTGRHVRTVAWPEVPGTSPTVTIASDDHGIWVHYRGADALARITPEGLHHAEYLEGAHLETAGLSGAWCVRPQRRRKDVAIKKNSQPIRQMRPGPSLLLALPDGGISPVRTVGFSLSAADFDETTLHLGVEHDPWTRTAHASGGFELQLSRSWMHVPLDTVTDRIDLDDHPRTTAEGDWHTSEYADSTYNPKHRRKRAFGDGIRWYWGQNPSWNALLVRGFREGISTPICEMELPGVRVAEGAANGDQLWLVGTVKGSARMSRSVLRISSDHAEPEIVGVTDDLDISEHCRPVAPEPLDHWSYVRYCIRKLDGIRFSRRMHEVTVEFVGDWPHGTLNVTFTHDNYEGLRLVKRLALYDEQGRRLDDITRYVPIELMEQAETLAFPDRSRAVDGVLYV